MPASNSCGCSRGRCSTPKGRCPIVTTAVLVGVAGAVVRWRRDALTRGLLALFVTSLLLSFGSTTWGTLAYLIPAHEDLYFRRFVMGSQLAGLFLAGAGVVLIWQVLKRIVDVLVSWRPLRFAAVACIAAGAIAWLSPAVAQISSFDDRDTATIQTQRAGDKSQGALIAPLIAYIKQHGGGRTYAGLSSNWGQSFTVGLVPVYKYLETQDVRPGHLRGPDLVTDAGPRHGFRRGQPVGLHVVRGSLYRPARRAWARPYRLSA